MSWLAIIFYVITNLPSLISLFNQLFAIMRGIPLADREGMRRSVVEAIEEHQKTGSAARLKELCDKYLDCRVPVQG